MVTCECGKEERLDLAYLDEGGCWWCKSCQEEQEAEKGKYSVSYVQCDICGHKWTAVRPEGTETLECPNCGHNGNFENLPTE